jgi:hypothetical protein
MGTPINSKTNPLAPSKASRRLASGTERRGVVAGPWDRATFTFFL